MNVWQRRGRSSAGGVVVGGDPFFSSVVLLALNESGADASTTFDDQSNSNHTLTANGNFQWDTAQFPTGLTSSGLADGTGDFISAPDSDNWHFAAGDFTVEAMVRFNSALTGPKVIMSQWLNTGGQFSWLCDWSGTAWRFAYSTDGTATTVPTFADTLAIDTWYHIAFSRTGANLRCWRDGQQKGAGHNIAASSLHNSTTGLRIGSQASAAQDWNGWLASARITKGVSRYTANFTPPSLPLLNS